MPTMKIKLKGYLASIEDQEAARPVSQRREVPTVKALANEVGISRVQLQRLAAGQIKNLNLELTANIIKAMRNRGFEMRLTDLIEYQD